MKSIAIGLVIGASLASSVGSTFQSLDRNIAQLQTKTQNVKIGIAAGENWQKLRGESLKLSAALQAGKLNADGVKRLQELRRATIEAAAEARRYGLSLGDLNRQLNTMREYSRHQEGFLGRAMARSQRRQERSEMYGQLRGTVALGMTLAVPIYQAVQFESVMADIRKVVDFETPEQFRAMGQDILDLSTKKKLPLAASSIGEIVAAAGQFGIARDELLSFSESAAKMAVAFEMSAGDSGEAMAKIRASTGLSQKEMVLLGDAINHLSNNTASAAPQLVEYMKRVGGVGKIAGLAPEKMAALGAAFVSMGAAPEVAARATNDFVMRLATASNQSKPVRAALKSMGYDAKSLEQRMKLDPQGTILEFLERAKKQKNVLASLSGVFGSGWADDIAKLVSGLDTYKKSLNLVADSTEYAGSMQKEYEARAQTTANELQLLKNQVSRLSITLGSALLPGLNAVIKPIGAMIETVGTLAAKYPRLTKAIGAVAASLLGLKIAILAGRIGWSHIRDGGSIAMDVLQRLRPSVIQNALAMARLRGSGSALKGMFSSLSSGIGKFATGAAADFSAFKAGAGAVFTPLTMSVAVLAGAIYLIWRNWEDFSKAWSDGCARIKDSLAKGNIGDAIMNMLATPLTSVMVLIQDIVNLWDNFIKSFGIGDTTEAMGNVYQGVQERREKGIYQPGDEYLSSVPGHASGGFIGRPMVSWIGEDGPEYVVPVGGAYRERGRSLLGQAASALGMTVSESGAPSGTASPLQGWMEKFRDLVPGPQTAMAGAGGMTISGGIHVHGTPGMDERTLADLVVQKIEAYVGQRNRGAYSDDAFFG